MGLSVYVYRSDFGDSTNGGLSAVARQICVVNIDGPSEPVDNLRPAFELIAGAYGTAKLVPVDQPEGVVGPMMGGNYAGTSDSRFGDKVAELMGVEFFSGAIPIHDRFETQELYDLLSR